MKIIICGDIHLGQGLMLGKMGAGSTINSRIVDQTNLLDHVLERAIEHNAEQIILTGDIFDDPNLLFIKTMGTS